MVEQGVGGSREPTAWRPFHVKFGASSCYWHYCCDTLSGLFIPHPVHMPKMNIMAYSLKFIYHAWLDRLFYPSFQSLACCLPLDVQTRVQIYLTTFVDIGSDFSVNRNRKRKFRTLSSGRWRLFTRSSRTFYTQFVHCEKIVQSFASSPVTWKAFYTYCAQPVRKEKEFYTPSPCLGGFLLRFIMSYFWKLRAWMQHTV